ncbi:hypothetical protein GUJ93_ZPchr0002g25028 [Zizania palustris]|uniref:NAC domain-containing protein n=1 Tax=Zizania palustris TaxID=103762 RepID=A0A8J5V5D9_ZIZPA|nr:hypothetical protein GUJ93_ZPchr0002g25028 [Zizania palustris]
MGLRDIELTLPPGFRLYPSDEELVCHYLHNKVLNSQSFAGGVAGTMVEVDLHIHEPWELPDVAKLSTNEWYFFSFRDRKYATGLRTKTAPLSPATGRPPTLVFYRGRAPNGVKTNWVMHEFRMENPHTPPKEDWVLCRVFYKKKSDTEYSMDNEQDQVIALARGAAAVKGCFSHSSSCHDPADHSPTFPSLVCSSSHHYQLQPPPPPLDHHDHHPSVVVGGELPSMALYNSIFDFSQHLDGGVSAQSAAGSRVDGAGDQSALMDLGLDENYNYNSLMPM